MMSIECNVLSVLAVGTKLLHHSVKGILASSYQHNHATSDGTSYRAVATSRVCRYLSECLPVSIIREWAGPAVVMFDVSSLCSA